MLNQIEQSFSSHLASYGSCDFHCVNKQFQCLLPLSLSTDVDFIISLHLRNPSAKMITTRIYFSLTGMTVHLSFGYAGDLPSGPISRPLNTVFTLVLTHMGDATFPVLLSLHLMLDKLFTSDHIPVV